MSSAKRVYTPNIDFQTLHLSPERNLWRAVCLSAWRDLLEIKGNHDQHANPRELKREARRFLKSEEYELIAEWVGLPRYRGEL